MARNLARGDDMVGEVEGGRPATVGEAVAAYERDLKARDANLENAKILRFHLPPALMSKPVAMLTSREVRALRDSLLDKGLKRSTVNRFMKPLAASLTLAANDDDRITNWRAWKIPALRDTANPRNVILTDQQVRDFVAASYETGAHRFGAYMETLAVTGARPIQARRLTVADLEADHADGPRLQMPGSMKGKGKRHVERTALPIPVRLATRLKAEAIGRSDDEPLLRDSKGDPWTESGHRQPFAVAAAAAMLPKDATAYALRHSFITRSLLKGIPTRLVAASVEFLDDDDRGDLFEVHRTSGRRPHARRAHRHRRARASRRQKSSRCGARQARIVGRARRAWSRPARPEPRMQPMAKAPNRTTIADF